MVETKKTFEELYNSACGVVGVASYDTEAEFLEDFKELETNPDFTFYGQYDLTQEIDAELEYQGLSLDKITKMSLNRYGDILEVLAFDDQYYAVIGAR